MKQLFLTLVLVFFTSCEKPSECIATTGTIITKNFTVTPFTKIDIDKGVEVIILQGTAYKLEIKIGENQLENIEVRQDDNTLYLKDNTNCNWVRQYGQTIAYITAPNIEEIYSKTEKNITSNGLLTFPYLKIIAVDKNGDQRKGAGTGDFILNIDNNQLDIAINNVPRFYISGKTDNLNISIYNGDARIEAPNFQAKKVTVFHRGSNDLILFPTESITGKMVGTGNIILKNKPPIVAIQQLYQGHVIYN